jgi:hypothetical protein
MQLSVLAMQILAKDKEYWMPMTEELKSRQVPDEN